VRDVAATARALGGALGVIAAVDYRLNLPVMEAALRAGCHYTDLGGLFHETRKQLRLHARFRRAGLLAVLGVGAAPGIVNVLARAAADDMQQVREIHIAVGGIDRARRPAGAPLASSYSLQTVLDEATLPAALFTGGRLRFVPAMSGAVDVDFPRPVGRRRPALTLHSELATLPASYRRKGIREVSFRIAFADELDARLRLLASLGVTSARPIDVRGRPVAPRDLLLALLARLPPPLPPPPPDEHEVLRVVVRGVADGRAVEETLDCHCAGVPAWGVGVDADTGCPPSILMQMIARGELAARGVLPPERAIPPAPFLAELERRGMRIVRRRRATRTHRSRSL
jgi:saccharopine dehydrogenase (NAD+, L-lysine-forming)